MYYGNLETKKKGRFCQKIWHRVRNSSNIFTAYSVSGFLWWNWELSFKYSFYV